jgi:hypothetical protein
VDQQVLDRGADRHGDACERCGLEFGQSPRQVTAHLGDDGSHRAHGDIEQGVVARTGNVISPSRDLDETGDVAPPVRHDRGGHQRHDLAVPVTPTAEGDCCRIEFGVYGHVGVVEGVIQRRLQQPGVRRIRLV